MNNLQELIVAQTTTPKEARIRINSDLTNENEMISIGKEKPNTPKNMKTIEAKLEMQDNVVHLPPRTQKPKGGKANQFGVENMS